MRNIPSAVAREVKITLPAFLQAVRAKNADHIMTSLNVFEGEPDLLHKCLWYASSHGNAVKVLPSKESLDRSDWEATYVDQAF